MNTRIFLYSTSLENCYLCLEPQVAGLSLSNIKYFQVGGFKAPKTSYVQFTGFLVRTGAKSNMLNRESEFALTVQ